jgi:hypothetical protein
MEKKSIEIGRERQLFLDNYLVEETKNIEFHVNKVEKYKGNPVLKPDTPWENDVHLFGTVVFDQKEGYKMWYFARTPGEADRNLCYATSEDGIRWDKPELGIASFKGHNSNILFGTSTGHTVEETYNVLYTPWDKDPDRRYKLLYQERDNKTITNIKDAVYRKYGVMAERYRDKGNVELAERYEKLMQRILSRPMPSLATAISGDGLRWNIHDRFSMPNIHDISHMMYDPFKDKYVVYGRGFCFPEDIHHKYHKEEWYPAILGRAVQISESKDFDSWSEGKVIFSVDIDDEPGDEIYSMAVFPYENLYIGLVQMYHAHPMDMTLDIQLAVSRDGVNFSRVGNRETFIPLGDLGEWDRFNHAVASAPTIVGNEMRFYYNGALYRHGKIPSGVAYGGVDSGPKSVSIGFGGILKDRFVYAGASFDGGYILTKPLIFSGDLLHLNCKSDFGSIRVVVTDEEGSVLDDFKAEVLNEDS